MTAPAIATPAAPALVAPPSAKGADALSARDFFSQDDTELATALGVEVPDVEEGAEEVEAPAIPGLIPPGAPPAAAPAPPAEGDVEVPSVAADKKLMTEFAVLDAEGELEIPDVKIRFKAKGEQRELPLDHVVRLAQFGFANEEREQQVMAARKYVAEAEQRDQEYQNRTAQYESYYQRLFNDPAFYEDARIAFLNQNTPEARADRAENELRARDQQQAQQHASNTIDTFVQQQLVPTVKQMLTDNPLVNEYEVIGRYNELIAPILVHGRVPLNRLPFVQKLVTSDLADWAQRVHYERFIDKQKTTQATQAATAAATSQVAQAKRQASRVFAHQGAAAPADGGPQKPVKYTSAREWLDSTFGPTD